MQSELRSEKVNTAAIDICRYNLVKCIKCDVPCSEGYGPGNLVTDNFVERSKGFLAERFIKPPVNLTLEFKSEINIEYIVISCGVGAQKSKGLELFSRAISEGSCYESVASGVLPDDKIGFVFHRFNVNVKDRFGEKYCFRTFKSARFISLVSNMKIKIFCTNRMSVPALGRIEIWGTPLKSPPVKCNPNTRPKLLLQTESCKGQDNILTAVSSKSAGHTFMKPSHILSVIKRSEIDNSFPIPEDFIDPITCEVMIQPIILPSGKVIDNSTLISHEKAELRWGRGPSDPFTGIPFSGSNKPIAASDLKCRIDKFLSDNCNVSELQNMPRTLGSMRCSSHVFQKQRSCELGLVVSKLVKSTSSKSHDNDLPITSNICSLNKRTGLDQLKLIKAPKRKCAKMDSDKELMVSTIADDPRNNLLVSSSQPSVLRIEQGFGKEFNNPAEACDTFQERMERSLELALKTTLSKLPKFTHDKPDSIDEVSTPLCNACKSIENLFIIPCNHFVCRFCLTQFKIDNIATKCLLCSCEYKKSDVQKVHTR